MKTDARFDYDKQMSIYGKHFPTLPDFDPDFPDFDYADAEAFAAAGGCLSGACVPGYSKLVGEILGDIPGLEP